jgi:hypothetical protein
MGTGGRGDGGAGGAWGRGGRSSPPPQWEMATSAFPLDAAVINSSLRRRERMRAGGGAIRHTRDETVLVHALATPSLISHQLPPLLPHRLSTPSCPPPGATTPPRPAWMHPGRSRRAWGPRSTPASPRRATPSPPPARPPRTQRTGGGRLRSHAGGTPPCTGRAARASRPPPPAGRPLRRLSGALTVLSLLFGVIWYGIGERATDRAGVQSYVASIFMTATFAGMINLSRDACACNSAVTVVEARRGASLLSPPPSLTFTFPHPPRPYLPVSLPRGG